MTSWLAPGPRVSLTESWALGEDHTAWYGPANRWHISILVPVISSSRNAKHPPDTLTQQPDLEHHTHLKTREPSLDDHYVSAILV